VKTLVLEKVSAGYGKIEIIHEITLQAQAGEIITILGLNGAGKSTLLRAISGLIVCRAGKIRCDDLDITNMDPDLIVRNGIVHSPEGRQLFGPLTVRENLVLGNYSIRGAMTPGERRELMNFVFDLFPILRRRHRQRANTLSGGEQQMLALGRSLMAKPKVILLDEPSLGLAPIVVKTIFDVIKRMNRDGMTIVLVEQDVFIALNTAARGYVIESGTITIEGDANNLLEDKRLMELHLGKSDEEV